MEIIQSIQCTLSDYRGVGNGGIKQKLMMEQNSVYLLFTPSCLSKDHQCSRWKNIYLERRRRRVPTRNGVPANRRRRALAMSFVSGGSTDKAPLTTSTKLQRH